MEWFKICSTDSTWYLGRQRRPGLARVERRLGKWSLEMWRPIEGATVRDFDQCSWEFVGRFADLEEAKRVGYTLARLEN